MLVALLFDPQYKSVLDDLRLVTRNLREVSDRVVGGRGTLGSLVKDTLEDGNLRSTMQDLQIAVANLKEITSKINEGEGTLGALIADPTVYEQLVGILDGAHGASSCARSSAAWTARTARPRTPRNERPERVALPGVRLRQPQARPAPTASAPPVSS